MAFPYNLLSDPEHEVAEAYGVWGEKEMLTATATWALFAAILLLTKTAVPPTPKSKFPQGQRG
ncbi:MAG: hypothetical protein R3D55_22670 [Chloroflexota bacterium]